MLIRQEDIDLKQRFIVSLVDKTGPALQCGIRRGDLLLGVNGDDVQAEDFSAKLLHDCQSVASTDLVMFRPTLPVVVVFTNFLTGSLPEDATEESDDRSENEMSTKK